MIDSWSLFMIGQMVVWTPQLNFLDAPVAPAAWSSPAPEQQNVFETVLMTLKSLLNSFQLRILQLSNTNPESDF